MAESVWYCPLCLAEGDTEGTSFCPNDGARVRPIHKRGSEWVGRTVAGKYRINRFLQAGGMGEVFVAEQIETAREVALKILHAGLRGSEEYVERFRQEAKLISLIAHRNVVALQDFGTFAEGGAFMVMELLSGQNFEAVLQDGGATPELAFHVTLQVCEGMAAAHERGVIHRDIKPANIFLLGDPDNGEPPVKILDLGIGKLLDQSHAKSMTRAGVVLGTPIYMAPEQCAGEPIGPAADIYALGVVLYEALLGRPPFDDLSHLALMRRHITETPAWDRTEAARRGIPPEAETVVLRALAKVPSDRQESMIDLQRQVSKLQSQLKHGQRYSLSRQSRSRTGVEVVSLEQSTGSDDEVVQIAPDTYWVGRRRGERLECNTYLRVFRGEGRTAVLLVDPGPPANHEVVGRKIHAVLGSDTAVDYVFLNHQDPDVAGSTPETLRAYPRATVVCSQDTWRLVRLYGLDAGRFQATESFRAARLSLPGGNVVQFIPTPFCHFRGAVMMYDLSTRVLFSGDLYGGTGTRPDLVAGANSFEGVDLFHQIYMPSQRALRAAVERTRSLQPAPKLIAPQHGAIITEPVVEKMLWHVGSLEVGYGLVEAGLQDPASLKAANQMIRELAMTRGQAEAAAMLHSTSADGSFSHILERGEGLEVTGFRIDPALALQTILFDSLRAAPIERREELRYAFRRILRRTATGTRR
jgi:serine/threonine-protein kinase